MFYGARYDHSVLWQSTHYGRGIQEFKASNRYQHVFGGFSHSRRVNSFIGYAIHSLNICTWQVDFQ